MNFFPDHDKGEKPLKLFLEGFLFHPDFAFKRIVIFENIFSEVLADNLNRSIKTLIMNTFIDILHIVSLNNSLHETCRGHFED